MASLEERLRASIAGRSEGFVASDDLPDRIDARVRHRRRQRQLTRGGLAAAAVAAALAVILLVAPGGDDEGSIRMTDQDHPDVGNLPEHSSTTTTTTARDRGDQTATSSTASTTSSTTATVPELPTGAPLDFTTGLSRAGIGPVTAGMTLTRAQDAAGRTITPSGGSGGSCQEATIEGLDGIALLVEPATAPGADAMSGTVRAVTGAVLPSEEGAMVGQSRAELLASLGQPTRTDPDQSGMGGQILVFEAGGYAYGALVVDDLVLGLQSGDPAWVSWPDGCP